MYLRKNLPLIKHYEGSCSVLFQFIPPSIQLIIVGAGNDAQPLVEYGFFIRLEYYCC